MKTVAFFASSSEQGKTWDFLNAVINTSKVYVPIESFSKLNIGYFDYEHKNKDDDFINLIKRMLQYDQIVLATPVYWYSMSAQMKTFMDRLSDLLTIEKDLGRQLHSKHMFVITTYATSVPRGFEDPFEQTCTYLGMNYKGCFYFYTGFDPKLQRTNLSLLEKAALLIAKGKAE